MRLALIGWFLAAWGLSFASGWPLRRVLLLRGLLDRPNTRSSHTDPTVRGGGICIVFSVLVCASAVAWGRSSAEAIGVVAAAALIATISYLDDLRGLSALSRFLWQMAAGISVLFCLAENWPWEAWMTGSAPVAATAALALGLLWIVGYTNAFNFMDGINGLASGQALVTGVGMALVGAAQASNWGSVPHTLSWVVAGAAAGFIPHNFPGARMFMGDVGSASLGFLLGVIAVWTVGTAGWEAIVPILLLHANFVLDTGVTFVRRVWRGERWYEAHREHFYQRFIRSGRSHAFVTLWEVGLQCATLGLCLAYVAADSALLRTLLAGAVLMLWGGFFGRAEMEFRQAQGMGR